jgi:hypothetical protein
VYIITAWDKTTETHVRSPDAADAVRHARDFVNRGMRISIVRTSDGQTLAITELEAEDHA